MVENQERGGAFVWLLWVESEIGGLLERKSEKRVHLFFGEELQGSEGFLEAGHRGRKQPQVSSG